MKMIQEFQKFALRGNLVDMAVGFTVGAGFTTIAKSLVDDVIMPPIGLMIGKADFSDLYFVLKDGVQAAGPYPSLKAAQAAGAVTLNYGLFINNVIAFSLIAFSMFLLIRLINRLDDGLEQAFGKEKAEPGDPPNKKCPYCLSTIPFKATRCPQCTSHFEVEGA